MSSGSFPSATLDRWSVNSATSKFAVAGSTNITSLIGSSTAAALHHNATNGQYYVLSSAGNLYRLKWGGSAFQAADASPAPKVLPAGAAARTHLATDASGATYITYFVDGGTSIGKLNASGALVASVKTPGQIQGMAVSPAGSVYFSAMGFHAVYRVNAAFNGYDVFAGSPSEAGSANGSASVARFTGPRGLLLRGTTLYVADGTYKTRAID